MFRAFIATVAVVVCLASPAAAQGRGGGGGGQNTAPIPSIDDRTAGMQKIDGYVPLYWDERSGSLFMEISRFDTEFLFNTGLAAGLGSNDIGLDRGSGGGARLVLFQRVGPRVLLVQPNQSFRSSSANALERKSVEDSFAKSVLWGFSVAAESGGRVLVDATDFFLRDVHGAAGSLQPAQSTGECAHRFHLLLPWVCSLLAAACSSDSNAALVRPPLKPGGNPCTSCGALVHGSALSWAA